MLVGRVENATRVLGAPAGWDPKVPCGGLPIRDEEVAGLPMMISSWQPTPDEIAAIAAGAPVHLSVVGVVHPPVALAVGALP